MPIYVGFRTVICQILLIYPSSPVPPTHTPTHPFFPYLRLSVRLCPRVHWVEMMMLLLFVVAMVMVYVCFLIQLQRELEANLLFSATEGKPNKKKQPKEKTLSKVTAGRSVLREVL